MSGNKKNFINIVHVFRDYPNRLSLIKKTIRQELNNGFDINLTAASAIVALTSSYVSFLMPGSSLPSALLCACHALTLGSCYCISDYFNNCSDGSYYSVCINLQMIAMGVNIPKEKNEDAVYAILIFFFLLFIYLYYPKYF